MATKERTASRSPFEKTCPGFSCKGLLSPRKRRKPWKRYRSSEDSQIPNSLIHSSASSSASKNEAMILLSAVLRPESTGIAKSIASKNLGKEGLPVESNSLLWDNQSFVSSLSIIRIETLSFL